MTYDIILFTDCNSRLYHAKTLGAHRIATELRKNGYSVKVLDFFGKWVNEPKTLFKLLHSLIGKNTLFLGFSGSFFTNNGSKNPTSFDEYANVNSWTGWPSDSSNKKIFLQAIRKSFPHVKLVYGGVDTDFQVRQAAPGVDYLVRGLADSTVIELADHLRKGTPIKFMLEHGIKIIDYDTKAINFDFAHSVVEYLPEDNIIPGQMLLLETSRGCLFRCAFCDFPLIGRKKGDPDYHKKIDVMAQELKNNWVNHKVNQYMIVDDTFNETTGKLENILRARDLAGVDIQFGAFIRADLVGRYPEQVGLLNDLGMVTCLMGIETLDIQSGKAIGKGSDPERIKEILYMMKEQSNAPQIMAMFIIGLPNDNPETLEKWLPWLDDPNCPIDKIHSNVLQLGGNSSISLNPEKYGYTITDEITRDWTNQFWSKTDAENYVRTWQKRWWENGRIGFAGWEYMGFRDLGYNDNYLKTTSLNHLDWNDVNTRRHNKWLDYRDLVLSYELK